MSPAVHFMPVLMFHLLLASGDKRMLGALLRFLQALL
jgi:hypothetical protein